jgi:hypothetical protein
VPISVWFTTSTTAHSGCSPLATAGNAGTNRSAADITEEAPLSVMKGTKSGHNNKLKEAIMGSGKVGTKKFGRRSKISSRSVSDSKDFIKGIHDRLAMQGPPPQLLAEWAEMEAQTNYAQLKGSR